MMHMQPPKRPFSWSSGWPQTEKEFKALMWGIDGRMHEEGLDIVVRPNNIAFLVEDAFNQRCGVSPMDALADESGYEGDILIAKARRWYKNIYGDRLTMEWTIGYVPAQLGNALWRVRVPIIVQGECMYFVDRDLGRIGINGTGEVLGKDVILFGAPKAAQVNGLYLVEGLLQALADRLPDQDLNNFDAFCKETLTGAGCFSWLSRRGELLGTAYRDYAASTDNLLNGRLPQSRWDAEQAAEKIIKGLLKTATGKVAQRTHDLKELAGSLQPFLMHPIDGTLLDDAAWPAKGRYAEKSTTQGECLRANHAVLKIAKKLSEDRKVQVMLGYGRARMS